MGHLVSEILVVARRPKRVWTERNTRDSRRRSYTETELSRLPSSTTTSPTTS